MLGVLADMRLQKNRFLSAELPPAVDKVFHDVTNLGYMNVSRNGIAIGQDKTRESSRVLLKSQSEFVQSHVFLYSCIGILSTPFRITVRKALDATPKIAI